MSVFWGISLKRNIPLLDQSPQLLLSLPFLLTLQPPTWDTTHQCKHTSSPSCFLKHSLCTRTFHLGFVGNFGSGDMLPYYHQQIDTPHSHRPSTPVGLVGCTNLLKWAWDLWVAHSPLYHCPQRSASQSHSSHWRVSRHASGQLQRLKWEKVVRGAAKKED